MGPLTLAKLTCENVRHLAKSAKLKPGLDQVSTTSTITSARIMLSCLVKRLLYVGNMYNQPNTMSVQDKQAASGLEKFFIHFPEPSHFSKESKVWSSFHVMYWYEEQQNRITRNKNLRSKLNHGRITSTSRKKIQL